MAKEGGKCPRGVPRNWESGHHPKSTYVLLEWRQHSWLLPFVFCFLFLHFCSSFFCFSKMQNDAVTQKVHMSYVLPEWRQHSSFLLFAFSFWLLALCFVVFCFLLFALSVAFCFRIRIWVSPKKYIRTSWVTPALLVVAFCLLLFLFSFLLFFLLFW